MRRATSPVVLLLSPMVLAACAIGQRPPSADGLDPGLAIAAVTYSAAMRSGTDDELRRSSCGAYAVVYRNVTDRKLQQLRLAAIRSQGMFSGSTVLRADQNAAIGEVTLADSYLSHGVVFAGSAYTFVMSKDSGSWKVCDTRQADRSQTEHTNALSYFVEDPTLPAIRPPRPAAAGGGRR